MVSKAFMGRAIIALGKWSSAVSRMVIAIPEAADPFEEPEARDDAVRVDDAGVHDTATALDRFC